MNERAIKGVLVAVIGVLVFLACSSGAAKIMAMEHDVAFFGKYGVSRTMLICYGVVQFIAGALILLPRTRFFGAGVVAVTFALSLVMLVIEGSVGFSAITVLSLVLLGWVMVRSYRT
ncbi:hypothetical protein SAMN05444287_1624 [Octadecabacter temperatus]|uniref:Uncharacterized protein n=1 Tax=Octadecabacter temperatus TaxID=1458307 RepID=A0A0K0Y6A6_9RHOB|nr:hypothetical protein [Octadecabacter temperatus]AKS46508.1 hypothetical protein OSB_19680 [Octadecabacter temperatus]SIO15459.1 hypothetical protein SAMN05444287_1624 [Octadecabacter temperatus]